jgi:hypothetical protein
MKPAEVRLAAAKLSTMPAIVVGPHHAVGIRETLARVPLTLRARVTRGGTALRIDRDDLFDLLGQRTSLLQQMFAALFRPQWLNGATPSSDPL